MQRRYPLILFLCFAMTMAPAGVQAAYDTNYGNGWNRISWDDIAGSPDRANGNGYSDYPDRVSASECDRAWYEFWRHCGNGNNGSGAATRPNGDTNYYDNRYNNRRNGDYPSSLSADIANGGDVSWNDYAVLDNIPPNILIPVQVQGMTCYFHPASMSFMWPEGTYNQENRNEVLRQVVVKRVVKRDGDKRVRRWVFKEVTLQR